MGSDSIEDPVRLQLMAQLEQSRNNSLNAFKEYLKMKTDDYGGIFKMTNQYLPIAYEEKYFKETNTKLKYRVYDYQSLQPVNTHNYDLIVKEGINYYIINTCPDGMDLEDGLYIFEVTDNSGTRWYTLFEKRDIQCN